MIDKYKIIFIHGDQFTDQDYADGKIESYGAYQDDVLHSLNLLNYARERFPEIPLFRQLTVRHQPEVIAYFLTKLGIVVFLNTTSYDEDQLRKYGKSGIFMMPDSLTESQKKTLLDLVTEMEHFDIIINYNLELQDGILHATNIRNLNQESPKELVSKYFNIVNSKSGDIKIGK